MFNLEAQILKWREQMLAEGIRPPVLLEELELHLREDVERQMQYGLPGEAAFKAAVQDIGRPEVLKFEFAKVRETFYDRLTELVRRFGGIPNHQFVTNMNTSHQHLEPGWATYLKAGALFAPALLVWAAFNTFVLPKLHQVSDLSGVAVPRPIFTALNLSELLGNNFGAVFVAILAALVLVEWRWQGWSRYRRLIFSITAYTWNAAVLVLITMMSVLAVLAGAHLLPGK